MSSAKVPSAKRALSRGRPPGFDKSEAVRQALKLFWERGYAGVTTAELTRVMGIHSPSLYHAFGDKAGVFRAVIELYAFEWEGFTSKIEAAPSFPAVLEVIAANAIERFPKGSHPGGCLFLAAPLGLKPEQRTLAAIVVGYRKGFLDLLVRRARDAVESGELQSDIDAESFARFIMAVVQGMAMQASEGATSSDLRKIAHWTQRISR